MAVPAAPAGVRRAGPASEYGCYVKLRPPDGAAPASAGRPQPRPTPFVLATLRHLKEQGLSIVLVEQNAKLVFDVAADIVILNSGRVAVEGSAAELTRAGIDLRQHLGIY